MATTLILLCAASTRSSRAGGFPAPDEPLDEAGRQAAAAFDLDARFRTGVRRSATRSAIETAAALHLDAREEPALADIDHGEWTGRDFATVHAEAPDDLLCWLADPTLAAPGGEAMSDVIDRVAPWLDLVAAGNAPIFAISHATVIRAALAYCLDLPLRSTLAIDVAPLSRAVFSFNHTWRVQALGPAA